jgi:hypothetical protein
LLNIMGSNLVLKKCLVVYHMAQFWDHYYLFYIPMTYHLALNILVGFYLLMKPSDTTGLSFALTIPIGLRRTGCEPFELRRAVRCQVSGVRGQMLLISDNKRIAQGA